MPRLDVQSWLFAIEALNLLLEHRSYSLHGNPFQQPIFGKEIVDSPRKCFTLFSEQRIGSAG